MEKGAHQMFESLKKFKALPDYIQVWPGHGAGSACGKALGAVPSSTVGYEKLVNWAMNIEDEDQFVKQLLEGQPEPPKYFAMMKKLNKVGPEILGSIPHPGRMTLNQFGEAVNKKVRIIDTRDKLSFAGGHIPGALNIQDNGAFSTWSGWMLNYDEPFILIAPDHRIEELTKKLIRIGLDNVQGYMPNLEVWANSGKELETLNQVTCSELYKMIESDQAQVIDVRGASEHDAGKIISAENIHAGFLSNNLDKVEKDKSVVVYCQSGDRSAIAASYLLNQGFSNVINLTGGYSAWMQDCGNKIGKEELVA